MPTAAVKTRENAKTKKITIQVKKVVFSFGIVRVFAYLCSTLIKQITTI